MPTFTMPAGLMNLMNPVVTNTMGVLQDAQRDLLDPFQTSVTVQQVSQQLFDTARGLESIPDVRPPWISPVVGFHQRITKDVPSELISPNLESIYSALSVRHKPSIFTEMETQKYFDRLADHLVEGTKIFISYYAGALEMAEKGESHERASHFSDIAASLCAVGLKERGQAVFKKAIDVAKED